MSVSHQAVSTSIDDQGIATVTMDLPGRSMNVLGAQLLTGLSAALEAAVADPGVRGIILTSGKPAFVAGADLVAMDAAGGPPPTPMQVLHRSMALSRELRRLETCGKPVACAINGTAVGGGLEIALACHYRVVADDPSIRLGLPEGKLGLLPAGGGTQRLPRMIGIKVALPLLLQGTLMGPAAALEGGLVDAVVPREQLLDQARAWLLESGEAVAPWDKPGFTVPGGAGPMAADIRTAVRFASITTRATTYGNYPAPSAILAAVYEGTQLPFDTALGVEGKYFVRLMSGPESTALVRTMFVSKGKADRLEQRPEGIAQHTLETIGILGAGTMGAGLALVAAKAGLKVVLIDRDLAAAERGRGYAASRLARDVEKGRRTQEKADQILERITASESFDDLGGVQLAIEAVFEDRAVKQDVIARARQALPEEAVLASNTSAMPITGLADYGPRPEQFIGMHFFSPAERMPLVEIIRGQQTSDTTLAAALDLAQQLRKTPIVVNDFPGFFTSRFIGSFITESLRMVSAGVSPALVENGARMLGMPMGALAISDSIGLEVSVHAARQRALDEGREPALGITGELVQRERFGRKNKAGFYDYLPSGEAVLWPGLNDLVPTLEDQPSIAEVKDRILYAQLAEGCRAFAQGVLPSVVDGDLGATLGVGFPAHLGGPFCAIDAIGVATFVARADELAAAYGPQFQVPDLVRTMAHSGQTFYGETTVDSPGKRR